MPSFHDALSLHESGDTAAAMREYRAVVESGGGKNGEHLAAAYSNLGVLLGGAGERESGETHSAAAAALAPSNGPIVYNWANALMELHRDEEAVSAYRRVLAIEGNHAPSYHNLALLAHRSGDDTEALKLFRATLACGPSQLATIGGASQVYANMAATGLVSAVNDEALAAQRAAAAANPKDASELVRLAERLLGSSSTSSDATAEAERALRAAVALRPHDDQAQNLLGTLLQSQPGRWQEAADAYQAALDARPTSGDAYHNLGTIHQRLGRYDDARRMYEASLKVRESAHKQPPPQQPTITLTRSLALCLTYPSHAALARRAERLRLARVHQQTARECEAPQARAQPTANRRRQLRAACQRARAHTTRRRSRSFREQPSRGADGNGPRGEARAIGASAPFGAWALACCACDAAVA